MLGQLGSRKAETALNFGSNDGTDLPVGVALLLLNGHHRYFEPALNPSSAGSTSFRGELMPDGRQAVIEAAQAAVAAKAFWLSAEFLRLNQIDVCCVCLQRNRPIVRKRFIVLGQSRQGRFTCELRSGDTILAWVHENRAGLPHSDCAMILFENNWDSLLPPDVVDFVQG